MKVLGTLLLIILTSLFYFPFNSSLLPSANTKMILALFGLFIFGFQATQNRNATLDNTFTIVSAWALLVSFAGLVSVLINETNDYTYATYIVSAWVWLGGAYTVVKCIKWCYGSASLRILTNLLIAVCVIQCILSQIIASNAVVASWVDSFMVSTGFMGKNESRLYGIGCALDVAGLKFCAVLILLSFFPIRPSGKINKYLEISLYLLAFVVISILGSMISRTTSIGIGCAILYWIYSAICQNKTGNPVSLKPFAILIIASAIILIPLLTYLYKTDETFYRNLRFGFEGFFSLYETGEWQVHSNEMMMSQWRWPTTIKGWMIGDGYFNKPTDFYYIGSDYGDFYMGTDIGYCRFVFYFGIIGLATFSLFFFNCARICIKHMPSCKIIFLLLLLMNFAGWSKVSSDLFPIFALILLLNSSSKIVEIIEKKHGQTC